jgi:hypothetical protein
MKETLNELNYQMVGHNLRMWRISLNVKRSELARQFNITVEDLINFEYAFEPIPGALVALICENWGLKLHDLTQHYFNDYPKVSEIEDEFEIDFTNRKLKEKKELTALNEKLSEAVNKCKYIQKLLNQTTEENFALKKELKEKQDRIKELEEKVANKGARMFLASPLSDKDKGDEDPF